MGYVTERTLREKGAHWLSAASHVNLHALTPRPSCSALLVVDMQNYFVHPNGMSFLPEARVILVNVVALVETMRTLGLPVFFTAHGHSDPAADAGMLGEWWGDLIREGTWDAEIVDELSPGAEEKVVHKKRYSAFVGTDLDSELRARGTGDLVICGVMTNLCCETTARDAFMRDYRTFFVADGTATVSEELHIASLRNLAYGFATVLLAGDVQTALSG